jgi:hypothetical protein
MRKVFVLLVVVLVAGVGLALAANPVFTSRPATSPPTTPIEGPGDPVNMVLDDGVAENNIGLNGSDVAYMYEWFNRFSPVEFPIEVTRIDVYWDSAWAGVSGGEAIELVVYEGGDDPCTSGGTIRGGQNDTIAALDTFDQYLLTTPAQVTSGPSVSLGVIDRWIVSGVSALCWPSALDTDVTQGRSFVAPWSTDPPVPPALPPDNICGLIDGFGFPGNWLIRGTGTVVPVELQRLVIE